MSEWQQLVKGLHLQVSAAAADTSVGYRSHRFGPAALKTNISSAWFRMLCISATVYPNYYYVKKIV